MEKLPKKLQSKLSARKENGSLRHLPLQGNSIDFSSNDYLGLAKSEKIAQMALDFLKECPQKNGSSGSRLLSGNHQLYARLEDFLASHHNSGSALVFNSGYDANIGFFSSVPQRGDMVLYDELVHASIRDGIQMGNAKSYKFAHNDLDHLKERILSLRAESRSEMEIYIVTESVFSMDGDSPDLKRLANFCGYNGCFLVVDEAHATGIYGNGRDLVAEQGLEQEVFARIITFGKAMGCHGAAILGSQPLKEYLVNFSRSFIYTTALPPHTMATILATYQYLGGEGASISKQLQANIGHFKQEMERLQMTDRFIKSDSAIQCALVPGNGKVKAIAKQLQTAGFDVKPILSPTVKEGEERLRFCLHAFNTKEEITKVLVLLNNLINP
ncbi:8-amino-7-oxononanoate synthase [Flagellimonas taeanensis]|jgi:8-amino-7-oxononanoate synthase|uniref:8-amino-7-oxononanoate synthase n=1 Tax=Flagellimonas taeanensis TaxID=1005926 RepID=A0A1M6PQI0_9FLAO|nr:8-amino-7-oxononanoate synthase [Allomuricauda taeanensis]SFB67503.1 8-amino-7-oxononanoate synthase [Allomuricauda taeanensis]SHK10206.1 8-amino-7-oxononanoate synthase [Allomuricauda taeanensis]